MSLADWFLSRVGDGQPTASNPIVRIVPTLTAPSRDEFAAWRDNPTTRFVMAALARNADECREQWMQHSWNRGDADQITLTALRERSDALLGFTADYEAFCETLNLEPEEEQAA